MSINTGNPPGRETALAETIHAQPGGDVVFLYARSLDVISGNKMRLREQSHQGMKSLFILFVVVHLLIDLAMPSLPGAFRFNPDESAIGVRVQPLQPQDLKPAPEVDLLWQSFELPRVEMMTVDPRGRINAPYLIVFLPRRDPSPDRSPRQRTEAD